MIVQASIALSVDGYTDDTSSERLVLSDPADWWQVYRLRAGCDALMVGAETIRRDDPSLTVKEAALRQERVASGLLADPVKVTVTRSGVLNPKSRFFTVGTSEKVVIVDSRNVSLPLLEALSHVATVVRTEEPVTPDFICDTLANRGLNTLFLEGGSRLLTQFLTAGRVDLLRIAVAPFFVGESAAPRFVYPGKYLFDKSHRMEVLQVAQVGDMSVTDYALSSVGTDYFRLRQAVELAAAAPRSESAYSVGALLVARSGVAFTGYSRETAPDNHAEEEAIRKAEQAGIPLEGAVMYSSMEPCSTRKSKPLSCSALIVEHKMSRVVFAAYEPDRFVRCDGVVQLQRAGISVTVLTELSGAALAVNAHILNEIK